MMLLKTTFVRKGMVRIAVLATASVALSGCTYDLGVGFASDGYGDGYYDCDPYNAFDSYYDCDNGYGFSNIGYGGGWYDNYWYPGHGFLLFDNYGRRFNMRDNHRRYWGERRQRWYRDNHGRHQGGISRDGRGQDNRGRDYTHDGGMDSIGSPDHGSGRVHGGNGRDRSDGKRNRNRWLDAQVDGTNAVPAPMSGTADGDRAAGARGEARRGNSGQYRSPPADGGNAARTDTPRPVVTPQDDELRAMRAERGERKFPREKPD